MKNKNVIILSNNIACEPHFQYIARIKQYFIKNGWNVTNLFSEADKVVICACGFHEVMYRKIVNTLNHIFKYGVSLEDVIILGCFSSIYNKEMSDINIKNIISIKETSKLDKVISADFPFDSIPVINDFRMPNKDDNDSIYYIKVADGCMMKCTYCVIKKSHGYIHSYPEEKLLLQYQGAIENGYKHIHLIGEDTLAYGIDTGTNIFELVKKMMLIDNSIEFDIENFHLGWISKFENEIIELCRTGKIKKLYVSMQHIDSRILKLMGRDSNFDSAYNVLKKIKNEIPDIIITTDIIVGFPGETRDEFAKLLDFLRNDTVFSKINHFGYSDNPKAESFYFEGKNSRYEILARWEKVKKVLKERSPYFEENNSSFFDISHKMTLDSDYFICDKV